MTRYEIRAKGKLGREWDDWFREMQVEMIQLDRQGLPEFLLTADLPDQSALLGVLMRLHNRNQTIISVRMREDGGTDSIR